MKKVLLFDFGTILVGLSKEQCVKALEQIGCGRIAYYVDECRQEDLFHDLEIGGSIADFCNEARRQSSYTDEKGVYHPCKATDEDICWAWNQLLLDIPVEKLRLIYHLHHDLGYHTAVLSNTNQIHWQYALEHLFTADNKTVNDYFDDIFLSCDLQMVKPDDCIYIEMFNRMRQDYGNASLKPSDILFIDDSKKNCEAAERNGISTFCDPKGDRWADFLSEQEYAAVIGNFDGVHTGHQHVITALKKAAAQRKLKPVVITFDRHPRTLFDPHFAPEYISTSDEKRRLLEQMGVEVRIIPFTQNVADTTARQFMADTLHDKMNVRMLLLGYDNRFGKRNEYEDFNAYKRYGEELGIEVEMTSAVDLEGVTVSSSRIRHMIKEGRMEEAAQCLTRPFTISGKVISGYKHGREIGFPTANIKAQKEKITPANGVYASTTTIGDKAYPSVTNIGTRPTYTDDSDVSIETHIIGYDGDLYGTDITVGFLRRLRDERKFPSPEELSKQIAADIELALNVNKQ